MTLSNETAHPSSASAVSVVIPIVSIRSNLYQPRRDFNPDAIQRLAQSIAKHGLLQPVVLRPRLQGGYALVAGERRLRAAKLAGLDAVPAIVRNASDQQAAAMALIENIQRAGLTPIEEAEGLRRLRDEFEIPQAELAEAIGRAAETVSNLLRLLTLAPGVQEMLDSGAISMGHARALLSLSPNAQDEVARWIVRNGLSVRQTEALVGRVRKPMAQGRRGRPPAKNADILELERRLTERLRAPTSIAHCDSGAGEVTIQYGSLDELERVLSRFV